MLKAIDNIVNLIMRHLANKNGTVERFNIVTQGCYLPGLFLSTLLLVSCGLSPQSIALNPLVDVRAEPIGRGRVLMLTVTDQRPQPAFGTRGGVYDTALIVPRTEVAQAIQRVLAERLRASGFKVLQGQQQGLELSMHVMIKSIDYVINEASAIGGPLINEVRVHAIIEAVVNNVGMIRSGNYQANSARRQVGYLSAPDNEIIINEVIAQVLKQLLQDQNILALLAQ
jgi:uncharacterized lipoprotein